MLKKITLLIVLAGLIQGCANTPRDTTVAHSACYSYIYGEHGYEQDYKKALEWCQKASDLNISSGHTLLAEIYFFGYGVNQDLQKSALIYEKAALQDHPHAQLMVFQIYNVYLADQSTAEQKATGLVLLKRAVNSKYPKAIEVHNQIYGQKI